jgi:murein DD-endopeptidase MepM/ murein hydrolase activator NlpD
MRFPLNFVPAQTWHAGALRFGANRAGGRRKHAGCDLYAPVGTPVFAVANGTVKSYGPFYLGTFQLTIDHGEFWVRYGEIASNIASRLPIGGQVNEGDQIGEVGDLQGLDLAMVHFEMYSGAASGPLTVPTRAPFMRRADLMDPTAHLDAWANVANAPTRPRLQRGSTGPAVIEWQRRLLNQGYAMSTDGDFGPTTEAATKLFQVESDLTADGIVGRATYAAMVEAEKD